jgi:hypothetical protein
MLRPTVIAVAAALSGCQQAPAQPAANAANIVHAVEHAQAQAAPRAVAPASGAAR